MSKKLTPPCSYQGGKQRLSKQIVDIIFEQNKIDENTQFYDLCCGSGTIGLELINRGINPKNITMIDNGVYGGFWTSISNNSFDLNIFKEEIDKLPSIENIQQYLKDLSNQEVNKDRYIYHYLLLQSGSFGSKQIWIEDNKWKNNSFRSYWKPTETSNRKSPVNPMMPMTETLYTRVKDIVEVLGGNIKAYNEDINDIKFNFSSNSIIYIDPPYKNTTGYNEDFNYMDFINNTNNKVYLSEGFKISNNAILLSKGRSKGNISGNSKKKPVEEWLNIF